MAITKSTIIKKISDQLDIPPSDAKHSIEALLEAMKSNLASGEDVMISGFGRFQVNHKAPRKGRNPATGEEMTLNKRRVVTFKCSGKLRDQINGITHE
jgi:integration host factor subunit alpha